MLMLNAGSFSRVTEPVGIGHYSFSRSL